MIGNIYINCIIPDSAVQGLLGPYRFEMCYMLEYNVPWIKQQKAACIGSAQADMKMLEIKLWIWPAMHEQFNHAQEPISLKNRQA